MNTNSSTVYTHGAYHGSTASLRPGVEAVDKGRGSSSVHDCGVEAIVQSVGVGPASE